MLTLLTIILVYSILLWLTVSTLFTRIVYLSIVVFIKKDELIVIVFVNLQ